MHIGNDRFWCMQGLNFTLIWWIHYYSLVHQILEIDKGCNIVKRTWVYIITSTHFFILVVYFLLDYAPMQPKKSFMSSTYRVEKKEWKKGKKSTWGPVIITQSTNLQGHKLMTKAMDADPRCLPPPLVCTGTSSTFNTWGRLSLSQPISHYNKSNNLD